MRCLMYFAGTPFIQPRFATVKSTGKARVLLNCTDSLVVKDPISDAGGPRFESHAGRVTGKPTPSLWRDKHPAIKGLWPPEHHAWKFRQDLSMHAFAEPAFLLTRRRARFTS